MNGDICTLGVEDGSGHGLALGGGDVLAAVHFNVLGNSNRDLGADLVGDLEQKKKKSF